MTATEAMDKALQTFGRRAHISDRFWREDPNQRFLVTDCDEIYGIGASWEAAFEDAQSITLRDRTLRGEL